MINKLLCIVGPTGTGKTAKAIELSKELPSIIISADSRQVYRGMDIVTGKDHPASLKIYGVDLVDPDESCSVSVWYDAVMPQIQRAWDDDKQVIVVGGTGLYVKAITNGIDTMQIPIARSLRDKLEPLSIPELQTKLHTLDATKFESMNHSDSLNPRRLIRAIEIATAPPLTLKPNTQHLESRLVGLRYYDNSNYRSVVTSRVMSRIELGAIEETKELLKKYNQNLSSMSAIGYKSIIAFLENKLNKEEMIEQWILGELSYAKRQMTWFRKQPVIWYDVDTI